MSERTGGRAILTGLVGLAALAAGVTPVRAQAPELSDGRWLPYLGCWVEEGATTGPMTCVTPADGGVAFLAVANGEVTERRVVRGDDVARPADAAGCTGTESARFSADGHRVFTDSRLTCGGAERHTRGLMAMVEPDRWIEVQALVDPGESAAWVKRYAPAPASRITGAELGPLAAAGSSRAVATARMAASTRIRVDAIIEANARTDPEAVKAWIVEQGDPLRLDADRLLALADAGVPAEVIDVAVAVSFPDRFAVARQPRADARADRYSRGGYGYARYGAWSMWSPWSPYYSPFYMDRYYGYSGYYPYSRYDRYWGYTPYSSYGPSVVVVRPVTRGSDGYTRGRVVKGRGFVPSSGTSRGTATRPNSSRVSPPSSSRGSVSGSSASTTRKAKRRTGGGGGL
jgi:hypothetical protein